MKYLKTDQKVALGMLVVLVFFLIAWIMFYPWEIESQNNESKKEEVTVEESVETMIAEMTLEELIYQMFIVSPEQITGVDTVTAAGEATKKALEIYPVGGIMYSSKNMISQEQMKEVISNSQSYSKINLFIAADEEGGKVNRLMNRLGTTYIDSMYTYKEKGKKTARKNAKIIAEDMKSLGFNLNFAPVADVWSNPQNEVIGERAYSDNFKEAAQLVSAAVEGFRKGGVLCTLKHFPGHGATVEDSHTGAAYVTKSLKKLKKEEFLPFEAGIESGAEFVMVGHLIVEEVDAQLPSSLSEKIIKELLRDELGYEGLIITDALNMGALVDTYTNAEIAVMAVKAGNDMLLEPQDLREAAGAIKEAVEAGEITRTRLEESVEKILRTKIENGIQ